ncbi:hypothetical protein SAMN04487820_106205 [Actinopolyspora mzabensis]|uniref:Uncharacterized protein n=1 Tax=Actinopolyspora mzabensis TaxID=995066 RepID=A0A1G9ARG4_ACTMZ|nr:hypothetical protein [Actinopolyspora mzabensis]SDK29821.1 hypothetical protein SAMN04487820_106205 [Actinopolyspora mzabensis]
MTTRSTNPVSVRCNTVEHAGTESLQLSIERDRLTIITPTVYDRTRWNAEQARQLRDTLTKLLGQLPNGGGFR